MATNISGQNAYLSGAPVSGSFTAVWNANGVIVFTDETAGLLIASWVDRPCQHYYPSHLLAEGRRLVEFESMELMPIFCFECAEFYPWWTELKMESCR